MEKIGFEEFGIELYLFIFIIKTVHFMCLA
jgi:hypothetical protein